MLSFGNFATKVFGSANDRKLKKYPPLVARINALQTGDVHFIGRPDLTPSAADALLYARLRAQTDELNRMAAVQTDFLRGVTHDLQTPLTRIGALAAELRTAVKGEAPRSDLDTIAHQAVGVADLLLELRVELARAHRRDGDVPLRHRPHVRPLRRGAALLHFPIQAFTLWDFRDNYRLALEELQDHVEDLDLEQGVLDEFSNPFYLIAFPALERDNILLHTLLGHEIGHLLVDDFLTEELESRFVQEVRGIVTDLTRKQLRDQGLSEDEVGQIFWPDLEKFWIASNLREVVEVWKRALEEILSDIAGAFLFGPAALFSTFELAFQYGFDEAPASRNNFYPPWRRRLREVLRVLGAEDGFFPIPSSAFPEGEAAMRSRALKQYYSDIEREAGLRKDEDAINKMPLVRSVYAALPEYIRLGKEFLLDDCRLGEHLLEADQLYRATPALIERLDNKIPPDQKGRSSNRRRDSDFVEIINAAWLHKVSSVASLTPACPPLEQQALIERDVRNRLTLKAIEFSSLSRRFEGM